MNDAISGGVRAAIAVGERAADSFAVAARGEGDLRMARSPEAFLEVRQSQERAGFAGA